MAGQVHARTIPLADIFDHLVGASNEGKVRSKVDARAVFMFKAISNRVICFTGKSTSLVPPRILAT